MFICRLVNPFLKKNIPPSPPRKKRKENIYCVKYINEINVV